MVADSSVYFLEYILITFRFPAVMDCFLQLTTCTCSPNAYWISSIEIICREEKKVKESQMW